MGKVTQSDFDIGSYYSNCSHDQNLGFLSLAAEHMLDSRANFRSCVILPPLPIAQLLMKQ